MGTRKPLRSDGGVNLYADPRALRDGQLAYAKNAFPTLEGILHKRESVQAIGYTDYTAPDTSILGIVPISLFVPDSATGKDFILHAHGGGASAEILLAVSIGSLISRTGPDYQILVAESPYPPTCPASFTSYRGRTIVLGGHNEGFYQYIRKGDGTYYWVRASFVWDATKVGVAAAQTQIVPVQPRVACSFMGRMVYANFGVGMGHWIAFADFNSVTHVNNSDAPLWAIVGSDVLADNGRHLELDDIAGQDIVAMEEVSIAAVSNPLQRALLVLTAQGHAMLCVGAPVQTTDSQFGDAVGYLGNFTASKVNAKCGGTGPGCICKTPYGTFWVGADDVWCLPTGIPVPVRVGTNIRPALQACPPSLRPYWSLAYADGVLFLAVATAASTQAGNVMYPAVQHWRLDLYDGIPQNAVEAQWYGPQDYEPLVALAGAGVALPNASLGGPCTSIVAREVDGHSTIVGACQCGAPSGASRTFFISYNEDNRPIDTPWLSVQSTLPWTAANTVNAGDYIRPSVLAYDGRIFRAQNAGTTAGAEPTWPTTSGGTVADGTVIWEEIRGSTFWNRSINYLGSTYNGEVLMNVQFKDDDWGSPNRDKILRRIDINALFETRAWSLFWAVLNQGDRVGNLGPIVLGDYSIHDGSALLGADNELGTAKVTTARASAEYQSKTYRPKAPTAGFPSLATPAAVSDSGIIRARSIQPWFQDLSGYIIDDTNDYIMWASLTFTPTLSPYVAQLTHGYYANMDLLMAHIVTRMNAIQGGMNGFTLPVSPWTTGLPYSGAFPYMTTLQMTFTGGRTGFMVLMFGDEPTATPGTSPTDSTDYQGIPCYPARTRKLLAMLGYDMSNDYTNNSVVPGPYSDGRTVKLAGEAQVSGFTASPVRMCGIEMVPYTRPSAVKIGSLEIEAAVLPGLPLSNRNK